MSVNIAETFEFESCEGVRIMSKAYEFLKECGYFYVLTINGDYSTGRPFGAVMEHDNKLYI